MFSTEAEAARSTFVHLSGHRRFKPEVASTDRHWWRRHLLPPSLILPHTHTHTRTLSLPSCVPWPESSSDSVHPTSGSRTTALFPYLWIKFNLNITEPKTGDLHTWTLKQDVGCAAHATAAPTATSSPILSLVDEFLPSGAFIMRSSLQSPLFDMTHDNLWKC